ncbi:MAG: hypothetical protein CVU18_03720 [Betaproteobacteria bacterium HGW-Betaproteobacteria-12]|nr:MAG: hypothetical protein CVU18_03720 [Betaproteobacteria bacterium HGW-Betaproteobacteria-12]
MTNPGAKLIAVLMPVITGLAVLNATAAYAGEGFTRADTHTHAWVNCYDASKSGGGADTSACAPAPRRYTPEGVLPFDKLQSEWRKNGIDYGVLVQVSFMGTDNSYIVDLVKKHDHLRGVLVLTNADGSLDEASFDDHILQRYHDIGIRGIRLNLQGQKPEQLAAINAAMDMETGTPGFRKLWKFMRDHDWHIEAQQGGEQWVGLIATLLKTNCRIVVDHFSRPDKKLNLNDPGWKAVLKAGESGRVWMKVSGSYRLGVSEEIMTEYARQAREHFGINRLLWGSDYPYTGCKNMPTACEDSEDYALLFKRLETWFPSKTEQRAILQDNPAEVFGFPLTKN